jgi:hypothetical protein
VSSCVFGNVKKSGEGGIRTLGTVARTPVFETGPIGHSGTSPKQLLLYFQWLPAYDGLRFDFLPLSFTPFAGGNLMPRKPTLRRKKVGKSVYWFTKAGGETYFGNVANLNL